MAHFNCLAYYTFPFHSYYNVEKVLKKQNEYLNLKCVEDKLTSCTEII